MKEAFCFQCGLSAKKEPKETTMENRTTAAALAFCAKALLFILQNAQWRNRVTQSEINVHIRKGEDVLRDLNGHY